MVAALLQLPKFIPLLLELIENKGRCVSESVCRCKGGVIVDSSVGRRVPNSL